MGPRGQPGINPYRDCAEIVRKSCNVSAVAVQSPQPSHGNRTEPVRDRHSHGARVGIVQCQLRHVYGLRSYDFSKFVKLLAKPNRRGHGARESVRKSHSCLLPPQGGLAEAARKGGYGQDTGSLYIDPSQAKCELGIMSYFFFHGSRCGVSRMLRRRRGAGILSRIQRLCNSKLPGVLRCAVQEWWILLRRCPIHAGVPLRSRIGEYRPLWSGSRFWLLFGLSRWWHTKMWWKLEDGHLSR